MKPVDNNQTDHYIIRVQSTIYEDDIKIIAYPTLLLITWNILSTTKMLIENILGEEFDDLHLRIILYRCLYQQQMTDFLINNSSGVLRLAHPPTGIYNCEIIASNSHNETITVKRSNKLHYHEDKNNACKGYQWKLLTEDNQTWLHAYSGYTVYE